MSCCRENRTTPMTERHRMRVRYCGGRPIVVKGPVTGLSYHFSGTDRVQLIDPRDVVTIVRNRLFRVEGVVEISLSYEQEGRSNG
jgi:hypothetical protein